MANGKLWHKVGWGLAGVLIVVGLVLKFAFGVDVSESADRAMAYFAEGIWATGVISAGIFS
ncbi:MAG: hypothetical protein Q7R34_01520, partial [Dehalococcoidia bacterium]|nr:hypothetical protein [Dehalococcoidia bacterium]